MYLEILKILMIINIHFIIHNKSKNPLIALFLKGSQDKVFNNNNSQTIMNILIILQIDNNNLVVIKDINNSIHNNSINRIT